MSVILDEMRAFFENDEEYLEHYGTPRHSGRYPWGSGEDPYQHGSGDFITRVDELRSQGFEWDDPETGEHFTGDKAIYKSMGLNSSQFRTELSIATAERRAYLVQKVKSMHSDGKGATEIAKELGLKNESTVRSLLNAESETKMNKAKSTAKHLKSVVDEKRMVDIGSGVEVDLGVSKEKLTQALYLLERDGYHVYKGRIPQVTNPGKWTIQKVLAAPDVEYKEIYDLSNVHSLQEYTSRDGGKTFRKFEYPASLDPSRVKVITADEIDPRTGLKGVDKDGLIEIRRGVQDVSLGTAKYAQVRILVGKDKYLKGMAVYGDDMPDGIDVIFNSNKKTREKALKDIEKDPENPFGATIKADGQMFYDDPKGKYIDPVTGNKQSLGVVNKRADEGDWSDWQDKLPSQFLAKQPKALAQKQLNLAIANKKDEYQEIKDLNNPIIKKYFLNKFADECDSAAVDLKAAALPGQKYHVIIPINTLKDNECYCPTYENGTKLALVRYPHEGIYQIPILTVNNKNKTAKSILGGDVADAIGINHSVANILSGADFDGDTVMCLPTHDEGGKIKIKNKPPLQGLADFDPTDSYGPDTYGDRKVNLITTDRQRNMQMGIASNLITDMTLGGASDSELARATRYSMTVIDSKKHKLDWKQCAVDNDIEGLKKKYQPKFDEDGNPLNKGGGASTILSRAKSPDPVVKRQGQPKTNIKGTPDYDPTKPEGSLLWKTADDAYYTKTKISKKTGELITTEETRIERVPKMSNTEDAYTLVSSAKHPIEIVYADYANTMKQMARDARIEAYNTASPKINRESAQKYKEEVKSLNDKLNYAVLNKPKEREAQRRANAIVNQKIDSGELVEKKAIKKARQQAIQKTRAEVNAISRKARNIDITDREWEAIQSGAISSNKLTSILNNADIDALRDRATPKTKKEPSTAKINKMKQMAISNFTIAEIAKACGVSISTVSKYIKA